MSSEEGERARIGAGDADRLLAQCASAAEDARARLAAVTADLFLPPRYRLSDARRAAMAGLAEALVEWVEQGLRRSLAASFAGEPALARALAADAGSLALPVIESSGVLRDEEFVAALQRRAEAAALMDSCAARHGEPEFIGAFAGDPAIAAAVTAYADAAAAVHVRSPFRDGAAPAGLPAELQHRLVWWVAAALRRHIVLDRGIAEGAADHAVMSAAYAVLSGYDEGATPDARAMALARALHSAGRLDDSLLADAADAGHPLLVAAGLAVRGGLPFEHAWDMAADPSASRLVVLLRACGVGRIPAARIALAFAAGDPAPAAEAMSGYEALGGDQARAAVRPWRLDAGYRRALGELTEGRP